MIPLLVLTTRPVRHPPIIVASDGELGSVKGPSIGGLFADPMCNKYKGRRVFCDPRMLAIRLALRRSRTLLLPKLNLQP